MQSFFNEVIWFSIFQNKNQYFTHTFQIQSDDNTDINCKSNLIRLLHITEVPKLWVSLYF